MRRSSASTTSCPPEPVPVYDSGFGPKSISWPALGQQRQEVYFTFWEKELQPRLAKLG